jgi:hypothetical protein
MPEPPHDFCFAPEKIEESRITNGQIGQKYLDRDLTLGAQVKCGVNGSHPTHPDEGVETILVHQSATK